MARECASFVDLVFFAARRRELWIFTLFLPALLAPSRADACSYPQCLGPRAHEAATVPSNAGGIWVFPGNKVGDSAYPEALELRVSDSGDELPLDTTIVDRTVDWDIRAAIRADLTPYQGKTLSLVDPALECSPPSGGEDPLEPMVVASFEIGPPADMPLVLGALDVTLDAHGQGVSAGGAECSSTFDASTARVSLVASEEAEPWLDVVVYETLVDGELHHPLGSDWNLAGTNWEGQFGGSIKGRGVDELFTVCPAPEAEPFVRTSYGGYPAGEHTVTMRAVFPDGTTLETPSVVVTLECPHAGTDTGCSAAPANSTYALILVVGVALFARRRRFSRSGM